MWYELEMLSEYVAACKQMLEGIENPENVMFHFCWNYQEYLERLNQETITWGKIQHRFTGLAKQLAAIGANVETDKKVFYSDVVTENLPVESTFIPDSFYNIAAYRRDLNHDWCDKVDFVLWGETDSLWPKQTLEIIEVLTSLNACQPKFILNFAGRKNWDNSWDRITHPIFRNTNWVDTEEWALHNEASEKAYMSLERMNEINNIPFDSIVIQGLSEPKADGSCLVISSDLIKSGVNIPHALIHCGEDESLLQMAKLVMGNQFVQYHVENILRVHNRRHPKKRTNIKGENNPNGFCDDRKGKWWKILEDTSKFNLENLRNQVKFNKTDEIINECQKFDILFQ